MCTMTLIDYTKSNNLILYLTQRSQSGGWWSVARMASSRKEGGDREVINGRSNHVSMAVVHFTHTRLLTRLFFFISFFFFFCVYFFFVDLTIPASLRFIRWLFLFFFYFYNRKGPRSFYTSELFFSFSLIIHFHTFQIIHLGISFTLSALLCILENLRLVFIE